MGFVALGLAKSLDLPLFDPNDKKAAVANGAHPKAGNGLLGQDPSNPDMVVATNGGSDLIYLPKNDKDPCRGRFKKLSRQNQPRMDCGPS